MPPVGFEALEQPHARGQCDVSRMPSRRHSEKIEIAAGFQPLLSAKESHHFRLIAHRRRQRCVSRSTRNADNMLMIDPSPVLRMARIAYLQPRKTPSRLVRIQQCAILVSSEEQDGTHDRNGCSDDGEEFDTAAGHLLVRDALIGEGEIVCECAHTN